MTSTLDPLSLRCKVASLSLFYCYYFGHCSDELAACIPPPMAQPRSTQRASLAHNYCEELISSVMVSSLLLPTFGALSLLLYFRHPSTFLPSKEGMIFFILPFLNILSICFILFTVFLFLFLRDTDSRKGTLCPFCVPIHRKKEKKNLNKTCAFMTAYLFTAFVHFLVFFTITFIFLFHFTFVILFHFFFFLCVM